MIVSGVEKAFLQSYALPCTIQSEFQVYSPESHKEVERRAPVLMQASFGIVASVIDSSC